MKLLYVDQRLLDGFKGRYPELTSLVSDTLDPTVMIHIRAVNAPYLNGGSQLVCNPDQFASFYPGIRRFFESQQKGISIQQAFLTLVKELSEGSPYGN